MLTIDQNQAGLCDSPSRRELLRVGGVGVLGLSLPQFLQLQCLPFQHPRQVRLPPTPTPGPQRQQQVAAVQPVDSAVAVVAPLPQPQAGQLQRREVGAPQQHLRVRR